MPPKKPDYSKDYTQWKSIHIEVPSDFITHTKSGRISIRHPLTRTQALSRSNKEPSITITENSDITAPKIINKGTRTKRPPHVNKPRPKSNRKLLNAQTRNEALINKMISESKRAKDNFTENDNEMKRLTKPKQGDAKTLFTKKSLLKKALKLYFDDAGSSAPYMETATLEKLLSFIPKYRLDVEKLKYFYLSAPIYL